MAAREIASDPPQKKTVQKRRRVDLRRDRKIYRPLLATAIFMLCLITC